MPHTLLIVDDAPDIASLLRIYFTNQGYTALMALTGTEGLALARQHNPDLMILDLGLPDMDGLDVYATLRAESNNMPIVMLTRRDTIDDRLAGFAAGADDYICKPFDVREVQARVEAVLKRAEGR